MFSVIEWTPIAAVAASVVAIIPTTLVAIARLRAENTRQHQANQEASRAQNLAQSAIIQEIVADLRDGREEVREVKADVREVKHSVRDLHDMLSDRIHPSRRDLIA